MFYAWLLAQCERADAVGIVAQAASKDLQFPRKANRLHILLRYFDAAPESRRAAAPELRKAMKLAHAEWRKTKKEVAQ